MPWNPVMVRQQWLVNSNDMNIHKLQLLLLLSTWFDYDLQGYTPKIWRNKGKRHKIINMQKLWRRDYNFNVNKYLPMLAFTRKFAMKGWFYII